MELGSLEVGSQRDWLGEYIWLSLVGPQLEAGAKKLGKLAVIGQVLII